jgi:hypothetical protein
VETSITVSIFFEFLKFYCKILTKGKELDEWPDKGAILFINPVLVFIGHRKDLIYVNGDNL